MIDWSAPEKTKEAVVEEYAKVCTFEYEQGRGRFVLRDFYGERISEGMAVSEMWDAAYALPEVAAYVAAHRTQEALDGTPCNRDIQDGDGNDEEGRAIPGKNSEICWACSGYGGRFGTCVTCHGPGLLPAGTRNAAVKAREAQEAPAEAQEDHIVHSHEMVTQPTHSAALPELKPVCPLCKGTGHKEVGSFAVAGAKVSITCNICRGRGWLYLDAEELTAMVVSTLQALSEACKEKDEARSQIHQGDGSCDHCGDMPSMVMPTSLCDECRDGVSRAEKAEAELTEARTLLANQAAGMRRLIDLVRHQRGELFAEQLISAEELAALVADSESGQRVARLESYDAMREKIKYQAAEIATLREKDAK